MDILTRQENRIARLVAEELAEKEIANMLCVSYDTIHTHTKNIRRKLGVKNNVGIAIRYVLALENPKLFLTSMMFLLIQSVAIVQNDEIQFRRFLRMSKTVKTRNHEA